MSHWFMLSLGSILMYNMPIFLHNWQIHIFGPLRAPFGILKGVLGCLWLKNMYILCPIDLCSHWDQFWYTTCLYSFTIGKFTFLGPLRGPKGPFCTLKGILGFPWLKNMYKLCPNDLCSHWDQFWYTTCRYSFTIGKFTFLGPLRGPQGTIWHP